MTAKNTNILTANIMAVSNSRQLQPTLKINLVTPAVACSVHSESSSGLPSLLDLWLRSAFLDSASVKKKHSLREAKFNFLH